MRPYINGSESQRGNLTPAISDTVYNISLAGGTAQSILWPVGANFANISSASPVWVAGAGNTATVPVSSNTAGTGSAYNKAQFANSGDVAFSVISATSQVISIEFWQ